MVIQSFKNRGSADLCNGRDTPTAPRLHPANLVRFARRKLDQLDSAKFLKDLGSPLGNRLGALGGDRKGQHSIRINDQYRICFEWTEAGPAQVEVIDYPG
jgi:proteic killer suppression protein